jgi:lactate permease
MASAWLSIPAMLLMAAMVPLFLPRGRLGLGRYFLVLACGLLVGLAALGAAAYLSVSISGLVGGLVLILVLVFIGNRRLAVSAAILRDLAPFIFLLAALLLINTVPFLRELTFNRLSIKVNLVGVHTITLRPFFSAYLYLFIAFALAVRLQGAAGPELRAVFSQGISKGWRASLAMGLFGAMGQMIAYSGYGLGLAQVCREMNIPWLLANGLSAYTGDLYPIFVPLLGWVGTFLTGYGVASLMLFGRLQVQSAELMGVSATWLAAGLAVGASLGSISSPFKIAIATPMCGALGQEGAILRWTIPLGAVASLLIGLVLWLLL